MSKGVTSLESLAARCDKVAALLAEARAKEEARKWWAGSQTPGEHERATDPNPVKPIEVGLEAEPEDTDA